MKQELIYVFITLLLNVNADNDSGWTFIGNPILLARPCNGSTDISVTFEPGVAPEEENSYTVFIEKKFPKTSRIILKFDADASVTLKDRNFARISASKYESNTFDIVFFKEHNGISFIVKGLTPGTVPYFTNVKINSKEYCKKPLGGFLDQYISGYQDHAESASREPATSCGRRKVGHTELIVSAAPTKPGDWPWHVALYKLERSSIKYICGGTLISENFVLTAAHCTSSRGVKLLPEVLSVVLGKYNLIGGDIGTQEREVYQIILHDKFEHRHLDHDIALIKLKTEAVFNDYVQPACLWYDKAQEKLPTNEVLGTIVGWGFDINESLSHQLNQASMPIVSENTCIKSNPLFYATVLNENKFCAGHRNGTSACNGDSGSAFQVFVPDVAKDTNKTNGAWFVRGIVSLTVSRTDVAICDPEYYVVFTDVGKYIHWINKNMKKN
ncbi:chymotrypsin-like elastase family member 2A [Vanessa tameamea]|uniref:Chymotrypsin-like elastase family member 2A n=1 Tax=Vanessa tameamea TaxID=334116 RepID=A0ABM4ATM2_VANTA